jgi:methylated-DNA-protein-cysteine methyltransferase related protein
MTINKVKPFGGRTPVHGTLLPMKRPAARTRTHAPFTDRAIEVLRSIPRGKVATYGLVAAAAGSPLAARQVVRVLHTLSDKERLPWHRVIGSDGSISLRPGAGLEEQAALLKAEGVGVSEDGRVNLKKHLWKPRLD